MKNRKVYLPILALVLLAAVLLVFLLIQNNKTTDASAEMESDVSASVPTEAPEGKKEEASPLERYILKRSTTMSTFSTLSSW